MPNPVSPGLTQGQLKTLCSALPDPAPVYIEPLRAAMDRFDIIGRLREAHFLAQVLHESGRLRYSREIWGPTEAQQRYEVRADLGNTEPGDGHRFLGRGLIQLTGRVNYHRCSQGLFGDDRLLTDPAWLETPAGACLSAAWFWEQHQLNALADQGEGEIILTAITRRINGGLTGLKFRRLYLNNALVLFKEVDSSTN